MATPGQQLAGYTIIESLGLGACGEVFLVEDSEGNKFAFKQLHSMSINKRLLSAGMARLNSDNVPSGVSVPKDARLGSGLIYLVSEFYGEKTEEGWRSHSLRSLISEPWSFTEAWSFLLDLASALDWMHTRGVFHGNLSPANILLQKQAEGEIKPVLLDWCQGWVGGIYQYEPTDTLLYLAPDQLNEQTEDRDRSMSWDVYSFGCIAWRILYGCFPRLDQEFAPAETLFLTNREQFQSVRPEDLSAALLSAEDLQAPKENAALDTIEKQLLHSLLQRCLSLSSADRPADMRKVLEELKSIEQQKNAALEALRLSQEKKQQQKTRSLLQISLIAIAAGLVLMIIYGVIMTQNWKGVQQKKATAQQTYEAKITSLEQTLVEEKKSSAAQFEEMEALRLRAKESERKAIQNLVKSCQVNSQLLTMLGVHSPEGSSELEKAALFRAQLNEYFLKMHQDLQNSEGELLVLARVQENLALLARLEGDKAIEEEFLQLALENWQKVASETTELVLAKEAVFRIQQQLALFFFRQEQTELALELISTSLASLEQREQSLTSEEVFLQAQAFALKGKILFRLGDSLAALDLYNKAAEKYDSIADVFYLQDRVLERSGELLLHRGESLLESYQIQEAQEVLEQALSTLAATREENPDWQQPKQDQVMVLLRLAELAEQNGSLEEANQALKQAKSLLAEINSPAKRLELSARVYRALAMSERNFGHSEELVDYMKESLSNWVGLMELEPQVIAHRLDYALALWDAGVILEQFQQLDQAILFTQQALDHAESLVSDSRLEALLKKRAHFTLGLVRLDLAFLLEQKGDTEQNRVEELLHGSKVILQAYTEEFPEDFAALDLLFVAQDRLQKSNSE